MLQGWDIGITDPTRVGRLPAGTDYFKKGAAAARMASRKAGEYAVLVSMYREPRPSRMSAMRSRLTGSDNGRISGRLMWLPA